MDYRKNRIAHKILHTVEGAENHGGMLLNFKNSTDSNPVVKQFVKWYLDQTRQEKYRIRKIFTELKKQNLISFKKDEENNSRIILENEGKDALLYKKIGTITILKDKKWDKKWRIVLFSMPDNLKPQRNLARTILKKLQFTPLQDGVWIIPLPCKNEVETLFDILKIRPHLKFIETPKLDCEESITKKALDLFW